MTRRSTPPASPPPAPLRLEVVVEGERRSVPLAGERVTLGRGRGNHLELPDPSVSRLHCELRPAGEGWTIRDLGSTNGVFVNQVAVEGATLQPGDRVQIGVFDLTVVGEAAAPGVLPAAEQPAAATEPGIADASIVRPVAEVAGALGLGFGAGRAGGAGGAKDGGGARGRSAAAARPTAADFGQQAVASMIRLAGFLIRSESLEAVLTRVLDAAFAALPVDRGFILLGEGDDLVCEVARYDDRVEVRPTGEVPVSTTMLRAVVDRGLALVTTDAAADARLAGGESIRIHQIRAAICAPLWSGERIVGVMQLDTPFRTGSFGERDLEVACALANYAAVAVERIRFAARAEEERRSRALLSRYHSPAVVEEVLRREPEPAAGGLRRLRAAEVTVLFADVVGFTPFAERATPEEVAALLGEFFDRAVEAVFAAGGTLDKFIGDCVMAFFGAPVPQPDHARRAVGAAVAIQREVAAWNRDRAARNLPPVTVRIAVNSGPVVVGEVGSERRVDYTVLGNTVNVAARLEEQAAGAGEIVLGPRTWELAAGAVGADPLGELRLDGLAQPIAAYRVRSEE